MKCGKCMTCPEQRDVVAASSCIQRPVKNVQESHMLLGSNICAQVWWCALQELLLQFKPLGTPELGQRQLDASPITNPTLPARKWRTECRQAARSSIMTMLQTFFFFFWHLLSSDSDLDWKQLVGSIIRVGCTLLSICQTIIIGVPVLYI